MLLEIFFVYKLNFDENFLTKFKEFSRDKGKLLRDENWNAQRVKDVLIAHVATI